MRVARFEPSSFEQGESVVAVMGAGITGLSAAWALRRRGVPAIVLESAARVGGVITTERRGDFLVELGPTSAMRTPELDQLIAELGLDTERIGPAPEARTRYVVRDGRAVAVPMSPPAMLTTPLLSLGGKLRVLADLFLPRAPAEMPEESVAALARRRFGGEAVEYLIDPMLSGIYAGDPERLSSRHTVRALYDMEQRSGSVIRGAIAAAREQRRAARDTNSGGGRSMFSFRGGLRALPDAMAAALGDAVRLRTRVTSIDHDGDRWLLECEGPEGSTTLSVRSMVSTVPAHALASVTMPAALRELLEPVLDVADVPVATLALGFRRADVAHPLDGFGMLVPHAERSGILGALFNSSIFATRAPTGSVLITCMIGGARNLSATHESEDALVRRALASIGPLLGITGSPTLVHGTRWAHAIPQYELGHSRVLAAAAEAEKQYDGLILAGSYSDGVSLGDRVGAGMRAGARAAALAPIAVEEWGLG